MADILRESSKKGTVEKRGKTARDASDSSDTQETGSEIYSNDMKAAMSSKTPIEAPKSSSSPTCLASAP